MWGFPESETNQPPHQNKNSYYFQFMFCNNKLATQFSLTVASHVKVCICFVSGNNTQEGNHTIYASNSSGFIGDVTIIYMNKYLPSEIKINAVFRYLIYAPPIQSNISEICEIGIAGECYTCHRLQKIEF